jgi:hypothetical protein
MSTDRLRALAEQLGTAPPEGLKGLTDTQLSDLAGAVREARHRQAAELAAASDQALRHIPKLLRTPLRKVLG